MFTGIVAGLFKVKAVQRRSNFLHYSVLIPQELSVGLRIGASISIDGVCQTVVRLNQNSEGEIEVFFDAIQETLEKTTLGSLKPGQTVNLERAAKIGDEIGGHLLSGHIVGRMRIHSIQALENSKTIRFQCDPKWMKYLFPKGFVAIDGASLTLVDVDPKAELSVHLIPETLRMTTLGYKQVGDWVNLELDAQTQAIVDTVERVLAQRE